MTLYYEAEELARESWEDQQLTRGEVLQWVQSIWPDFHPEFEFAEHELAGYVSGLARTIHLDPRLLNAWTVVHELAHWLHPFDGHGPEFHQRQLELVETAFGPDRAEELADAYALVVGD